MCVVFGFTTLCMLSWVYNPVCVVLGLQPRVCCHGSITLCVLSWVYNPVCVVMGL